MMTMIMILPQPRRRQHKVLGRVGGHAAGAVQAQDGEALREEQDAQRRERGGSPGHTADIPLPREPQASDRRCGQARRALQVQEGREHVRSCGKCPWVNFSLRIPAHVSALLASWGGG